MNCVLLSIVALTFVLEVISLAAETLTPFIRTIERDVSIVELVHAKVISERLGHSNIKTTLDIYSYILPNIQESANQIDVLLSKTQ